MSDPPDPRICICVVGHVLTPPVRAMFERLRGEAPADHDTRFVLSADDPAASLAGLDEADVDRISRDDIFRLPYPRKCVAADWVMAGNLDTVFLEFARRHPEYGTIWFVEYDVHWEGHWSALFEHFRDSPAAVLGATMQPIDEVPHKDDEMSYPRRVIPPGMDWERDKFIKGFLPLCRISRPALEALDAAYRAGLCGHYEFMVPSVAAHAGLLVEDFGGDGRYVRPENRNRFYFARGASYTHSPGNFVFRPPQRPLRRPNTMWHPVKPGDVPNWHPLRVGGNPLKALWERVKPTIGRQIIRFWFATKWRPLRTAATAPEVRRAARVRAGAASAGPR